MAESLISARTNDDEYWSPWDPQKVYSGESSNPSSTENVSEKRLTNLMVNLFKRTDKEGDAWAIARNEALARKANEAEAKDGIDLVIFNLTESSKSSAKQQETSMLPIDITFSPIAVESMDLDKNNNVLEVDGILKTKNGYTELFEINGVTARYGFRETHDKHRTANPVCVILFELTGGSSEESTSIEITNRLQDSPPKHPAEFLEQPKNYMLSDYYAFKHRKNPEDQTSPLSSVTRIPPDPETNPQS